MNNSIVFIANLFADVLHSIALNIDYKSHCLLHHLLFAPFFLYGYLSQALHTHFLVPIPISVDFRAYFQLLLFKSHKEITDRAFNAQSTYI